MPHISLKVSEPMNRLLRQRAAQTGHSLNHFILQCVEEGLRAKVDKLPEEPSSSPSIPFLEKVKLKLLIEIVMAIRHLLSTEDENLIFTIAQKAKEEARKVYGTMEEPRT